MSKNISQIIILFLLIALPVFVLANTINLKTSQTYTKNEIYFIDVSFDFTLTDEALEALRHGIPLEIHTLFQLRMTRNWFWDKTINEIKISQRLEHQPLTEDYLTIDLQTGQRRSYDNLDAALNNISSISKQVLFNKTLLRHDKNYTGRVRTYLDLDSLPSPMRPQVYFSDEWNIASDWHEWKIEE